MSYLALSFDGWTSISHDSYLGILPYFIDGNWQLQKMMLDLPKITDISEDAESIADVVVCVLSMEFLKKWFVVSQMNLLS